MSTETKIHPTEAQIASFFLDHSEALTKRFQRKCSLRYYPEDVNCAPWAIRAGDENAHTFWFGNSVAGATDDLANRITPMAVVIADKRTQAEKLLAEAAALESEAAS